jgi:fermentation-respiration switch protein FrsA (DUF1100 family)
MIAPLTGNRVVTTSAILDLADRLATTALQRDPLLDPRSHLDAVRLPVLVAHGRDDRLIPFSESLRLAEALPAATVRRLTITALFQHSGGTQSGLGPFGLARESARFMLLLRSVLRLV